MVGGALDTVSARLVAVNGIELFPMCCLYRYQQQIHP